MNNTFTNLQNLKEFLDSNNLGLKTFFDQISAEEFAECILVEFINRPNFFTGGDARKYQTQINIKVFVERDKKTDAMIEISKLLKTREIIFNYSETTYDSNELFQLNHTCNLFINEIGDM